MLRGKRGERTQWPQVSHQGTHQTRAVSVDNVGDVTVYQLLAWDPEAGILPAHPEHSEPEMQRLEVRGWCGSGEGQVAGRRGHQLAWPRRQSASPPRSPTRVGEAQGSLFGPPTAWVRLGALRARRPPPLRKTNAAHSWLGNQRCLGRGV